MDLNDRSIVLLNTLVQRYIEEGTPVGSKKLLDASGLALSPATIRNIMADLEDHGLVCSPHTSAGRIPTSQGYRLFVNRLLQTQNFSTFEQPDLENFNPDLSRRELVEQASKFLSSMTSQAGIVTLPKTEVSSLRHVEFLPLSGTRVLVILVVDEHEVQNRVIHTERPYEEAELKKAAAFINSHYAGQSLESVRHAILNELDASRAKIDKLMRATVEFASKAIDDQSSEDYVVAGQSNLLDTASPDNMDMLKDLFSAFQQKQDILQLMNHCMNAEGVEIFIGEESGYQVLDDYSVITAPYQSDVEKLGVLAVVGPTRMAYERVIPIVDMTSRLLSAALSQKTDENQ